MAIKLLKGILDKLPFVYCSAIHVPGSTYGLVEHTEYIYGLHNLKLPGWWWNDVLCSIRVFKGVKL